MYAIDRSDAIDAEAFDDCETEQAALARLQPFLTLGERLGAVLAQMNEGRTDALGVRYYGDLADRKNDLPQADA